MRRPILFLFVLLSFLPVLVAGYALEDVPPELVQHYLAQRITDDGIPLVTPETQEYLLDPSSRAEAQAVIDSYQNDSSAANTVRLLGRNDVLTVMIALNASCNLTGVPEIAITQEITTENYRFLVMTLPKPLLIPLLQNDCVYKFAEGATKEAFYTYAQRILEEERRNDSLSLNWAATSDGLESYQAVLDDLDASWDKSKGKHSPLQQFVTPKESSVISQAGEKTPEQIFDIAIAWPWVSDPRLWTTADRWLKPAEFLEITSRDAANPFPGRVSNDCEEHANTLVSLLRASGVSAKDVRVAIGDVRFEDGTTGGHAWVELRIDDTWTVLDSTLGPFYDDATNQTVERSGVSFDYWKYHEFPITKAWAYYNDEYFLDLRTDKAPGSWDEKAGTLFEKQMNEGLETPAWERFLLFLSRIAAKFL